jgi:thymidylate kinase
LRRAILAHACPAPDLSVVLDAPADVLYARKPEHSPALLEEQRQCYRSLQRRVPRVVIVDATLPLADVRRTVMALVWERYRFGRHAPTTVTVGKA